MRVVHDFPDFHQFLGKALSVPPQVIASTNS